MRSLTLSAAILGLCGMATALPARPRSELSTVARDDASVDIADGFRRREEDDVVVADGFKKRDEDDVVVADGFKKREGDDVVVADGF
ncbi:hypothetical protein F5X99DRAFT_370221 [Biscogniauxia marginata]|nr:hypothetical protein F5X99DRAFT_370221 [Biscogniauxia marginata]